jgi:tetratricopeptide (TPR) repeat protein
VSTTNQLAFAKPATCNALRARPTPVVIQASCSHSLRQIAAFAVLCMAFPATGCRLASQGQNTAGVQLYQQGQYQAAIQRFQQSIATDPQNPNSYYNLASTYHQMGKLDHRQDELDQAESFYNQCLDHDANHQECYRALAVLLCEQGRQEDAQRLLEGWSNRSPMLAAPKVELARLSQEFGNHDKAKEHLIEALAADPYDRRARAALGSLHEQTGNPSQALANYERSLSENRFQPEVAARVASLRTSLATSQTQYPGVAYPPGTIIPANPSNGTMMVTNPNNIR